MYLKSNNIEIMIGNETNEIINQCFELLLTIYQQGLEESMKSSDFAFNSLTEWIINALEFKSQCIVYRFSWLDKKEKSNNKFKKQ